MRIPTLSRFLFIPLLALMLIGAAPHTVRAQTAGELGAAAVHVVAWGETLATISEDYGISAERIIAANHLDQPDMLYAGTQLVIPGAMPIPAPSAQNGTHVVQAGETIFRIATKYGITVADVKVANGLVSDLIYTGQVLIIPAAGTAANQPAPSGNTGGIHVVQPGETVGRISQRYGVSIQAIISANGLVNPSLIYTGQTLIIPGANTTPNEPPPPAATTPVTGSHIVQRGETLGAIAQRYGVSIAALVQANALMNPSLIYTGQRLVIPGGGTSSGPATQPSGSGTHTVQRGETLFRIATQYGITVSALMSSNGLSNSIIYTGQVLTIPSGSGAAPVPQPSGNSPAPTVPTGKQIVIVLSQQKLYAYENGVLLREFIVSTGLPATPTVQGDFSIYLKYESQRMTGPDYDLPGVPWVMYFYQGYGIHGTYWHNNFGNPMSHGCVNMRTPEAEWMYYWAAMGTPVKVIWG